MSEWKIEEGKKTETCLGGIACQRREKGPNFLWSPVQEQDKASSTLYDSYTRQNPTEANEAFHSQTGVGGFMQDAATVPAKGGQYRT